MRGPFALTSLGQQQHYIISYFILANRSSQLLLDGIRISVSLSLYLSLALHLFGRKATFICRLYMCAGRN